MLVLPSRALQKWVCVQIVYRVQIIYFPIASADCRFPHVAPDGTVINPTPYYGGRGGAPRPRQANGNGIQAIEEKVANLSIREVDILSFSVSFMC